MEFTPQERQIFEYHDGAKLVKEDPLDLKLRVEKYLGPNPNEIIDQCDDAVPAPERHDAYQSLYKAMVNAFELHAFNKATGLGYTIREAVELWNRWQDFLREKKTPSAATQTSPTPSAPGSSPSGSATPSTSASC
jgi:hypothetical protein